MSAFGRTPERPTERPRNPNGIRERPGPYRVARGAPRWPLALLVGVVAAGLALGYGTYSGGSALAGAHPWAPLGPAMGTSSSVQPLDSGDNGSGGSPDSGNGTGDSGKGSSDSGNGSGTANGTEDS